MSLETSNHDTAPKPSKVTVIVTPRERFGVAIESLESIVAHTRGSFELIYIDAGSPDDVSARISEICGRNGFRHMRDTRFLSPNQARNIGWKAATTPYVLFVDNDVVASEGWLDALVACADETGAEVVAPLTCQKLPLHSEIHQAGGRFTDDLATFFDLPPAERRIAEEHVLQGRKVADVVLTRGETQCCEFHCALVRRDTLTRLGGLDEKLLATKEHIDFCMTVWRSGGKVVFEPTSIVTYLFPDRSRPIERRDWAFFTLRWSPVWQKRSLDHFKQKWQLTHDPYFQQRENVLSWRHHAGIAKPAVRKLPLVGAVPLLTRVCASLMVVGLGLWSRVLAATHRRQTAAPS